MKLIIVLTKKGENYRADTKDKDHRLIAFGIGKTPYEALRELIDEIEEYGYPDCEP